MIDIRYSLQAKRYKKKKKLFFKSVQFNDLSVCKDVTNKTDFSKKTILKNFLKKSEKNLLKSYYNNKLVFLDKESIILKIINKHNHLEQKNNDFQVFDKKKKNPKNLDISFRNEIQKP